MDEINNREWNESKLKARLWVDSQGQVQFHCETVSPKENTPEHFQAVRKALLSFIDKLQTFVMAKEKCPFSPKLEKKYCYGFYPDPELFYDWETFQDLLFDGRLHGEVVEVVRGVPVEFDNEDFISPHQIGEDILAQAEDEGGEYAEAYVEEVSAFFDNNEEKVRAVLSQMMELSDIRPTFFSVEKEEIVTVSVGNRDEGHIKVS